MYRTIVTGQMDANRMIEANSMMESRRLLNTEYEIDIVNRGNKNCQFKQVEYRDRRCDREKTA